MSRTLGTYKLKHCIELETRLEGETKVDELKPAGFCVVMKRPKAKDMRVFDQHEGQDISALLAILPRITNLDVQAVENLDAEDMAELGNLFGEHAPDGRTTGADEAGADGPTTGGTASE